LSRGYCSGHAEIAGDNSIRTVDQSSYAALAFEKAEDDSGGIVACDPKEARSADQAIDMASALAKTAGYCGAIAFSRTGDPALRDFEDAIILKAIGVVDNGLLST
jgi:hypothetical protein